MAHRLLYGYNTRFMHQVPFPLGKRRNIAVALVRICFTSIKIETKAKAFWLVDSFVLANHGAEHISFRFLKIRTEGTVLRHKIL